jgi:hypothetical protein
LSARAESSSGSSHFAATLASTTHFIARHARSRAVRRPGTGVVRIHPIPRSPGSRHDLLRNPDARACLILEELGGYCALFDGTPYRPMLRTGGLLCTPDRDRWRSVHEALLGS